MLFVVCTCYKLFGYKNMLQYQLKVVFLYMCIDEKCYMYWIYIFQNEINCSCILIVFVYVLRPYGTNYFTLFCKVRFGPHMVQPPRDEITSGCPHLPESQLLNLHMSTILLFMSSILHDVLAKDRFSLFQVSSKSCHRMTCSNSCSKHHTSSLLLSNIIRFNYYNTKIVLHCQ